VAGITISRDPKRSANHAHPRTMWPLVYERGCGLASRLRKRPALLVSHRAGVKTGHAAAEAAGRASGLGP